MTSWQRPPGPLNVWNVVDGYETLENGTKRPVKFSIQDIPNEPMRREEVMNLMTTHFLAGEPLSKCTKIKEDPNGVKDFQTLWKYGLDQGICVGCYKLDPNGKIDYLVGANIVFVISEETKKDFDKMKETFKSPKFMKIWKLFEKLSQQVDIFEKFNVDKYIGSISLSTLPAFRGQKLGLHILNARSGLGEKYGFTATSTMFTAEASQIQAKRAGFEEVASINYADLVDEHPEFAHIESKSAKIMSKKLP